jgi:hypothetical protein
MLASSEGSPHVTQHMEIASHMSGDLPEATVIAQDLGNGCRLAQVVKTLFESSQR